MDMKAPTALLAPEDLSDRSESSQSESQLHAFQEYERIKELNLSMSNIKDACAGGMSKDFNFPLSMNGPRLMAFYGLTMDRRTIRQLSVLPDDSSKDLNYTADDQTKDVLDYPLTGSSNETGRPLETAKDRSEGVKDDRSKDIFFGFQRDGRGKTLQPMDGSRDPNSSDPERKAKDFDLTKSYPSCPPLDRIKDFGLSLDRIREPHVGNLVLKRPHGKSLLDNPSILEPGDFRNQQIRSRNELEETAPKRMRRTHLFTPSDLASQTLQSHLPHPHTITQMQCFQQQQQQQQQVKSFTIDAILGLRNNQRDKQQRGQQQQYRKREGQEASAKNDSSSSRSSSGGKSKRVRTIFTAEQLERLEGEFARQQYMVGPERLYLAHALRLTEAQVKVWFQNRRIKWRKLNHEQSQRLQELHQHSLSSVEPEDSNDTKDWCN